MIPNCHVVQVSKVRMNPYVRLLQKALQEEGLVCSVVDGISPRQVRSLQGMADVWHLHWLELLYASPSFARSICLLAAVLTGLILAKRDGGKIVYTVHNVNPHEQRFPILGRIANTALFALADALHVHDKEAEQAVPRAYPFGMSWYSKRGKKIYVVPHGSYIGAYPDHCSKEEARARLGLDEQAFVYLFLGQVRRYKGIEDLITAFSQLQDSGCQLMIAGHVHDAAYAAELRKLVESQPGVHTRFEYVPDSEIQYFMKACDACVLPYRDVTTSGAAVLAFSFGRPVIAPALGGFLELVSDKRGILYDPRKADGLLVALQRAREVDLAQAGQEAWSWAKQHEWRILAPSFIRIYNAVWKKREVESDD